MIVKELKAEIVKSGTWLYAGEFPHEIWIVKQNFEYDYEEEYEEKERLSETGEVYKVLYAKDGSVIGHGSEYFSLTDAILGAESVLPQGIKWDDHRIHRLFGGRQYSISETAEQ